jgi:hypothetical protein
MSTHCPHHVQAAHLDCITQHRRQLELFAARHPLCRAGLDPALEALCAVRGCEGTQVGDLCCCQQNITRELDILLAQVLGSCCPTALLATKASNQLLGPVANQSEARGF